MSDTLGPKRTNYLLEPRPYPRKLSIVMPMYNEEQTVSFLRTAIGQFMQEIPAAVEIVLVNDGSSDSTGDLITDWAIEDPRIKAVHLSRNFGHQNASTAGLDFATGDAIVLMDADLQDPLSAIHEMIARYCEGYDVVYGQRKARSGETRFKRATAWCFYRLMRGLVHKDLPVDTGDFRLISRTCLSGLQQLRETHRFLRGMVAWVGYPQIAVSYEREARVAGETKYPLRKMLAFAWTAATSFSALPLKASMLFGLAAGLFGLEEAVRATLAHMLHWYTVSGWTSLMVVVCVIGGAILVSIGIVGEYVGKVYEQTKNRPIYLVSRSYNVEQSAAAAAASGQDPRP